MDLPVPLYPVIEVINKSIKCYCPAAITEGHHLYQPLVGLCTADHNPLSSMLQPIFQPTYCPLVSLYLTNLPVTILCQTVSKSLLKSRYTTVAALSLALQPVISSGKTMRLVRHNLPLVNWCWLFPISFSYFMRLQKTLRSSQWLGWDCPARSSLDSPFHTSWRLLPHPCCKHSPRGYMTADEDLQ